MINAFFILVASLNCALTLNGILGLKDGVAMIEKLIKDKHMRILYVPNHLEHIFSSYKQSDEAPYQIILTFANHLDDMKKAINESESLLVDGGYLYLCYPKLKNSLSLSGIHRDHIFPYLSVDESSGYIASSYMRFNMMRSFDENYTLLGIKKDQSMKKRSGTSQKTDDYLSYIPKLMIVLKDEACLAFFKTLTQGYQKSWARYIYSAKTEETRTKRIKEMITLLNQGVKSIDLKRT